MYFRCTKLGIVTLTADQRVTEIVSGGPAGAGVMAGEMAHFHEKLITTQQQLCEVTKKYNKLLAQGGSRCVGTVVI